MGLITGCGVGVGFSGGGPVLWTPRSKASCKGWWRTDVGLDHTSDPGKGSTWVDRVAGLVAAQGNAALRPAYNDSGAFPELEFRTALGTFLAAASAVTTSRKYTLVIVHRVPVPSPVGDYAVIAANGQVPAGSPAPGQCGFCLLTAPAAPATLQGYHPGVAGTPTVAETADLCWVLTSHNQTDAVGRIVRNGVASTGAQAACIAPANAFSIGAAHDGTMPCSSNLREVMVFDEQLSTDDENRIDEYVHRIHTDFP